MENNFVLQGAITWYSCSIYEKLENISNSEKKEIIEAVSSFTSEVAPYRDNTGKFPIRNIPVFGEVSIIYAIAISVAILVKDQIESGYKDHVKSLNPLLSYGVDGWETYQLLKNKK